MPDAKQGIPQEKLKKFFGLFAPEYVLGTTYTISLAFFESVVFPCINRSRLKRCILFCDRKGFQRATSEATALRGASREYMVVTAPTKWRFHPKLWLLIGESQLALLVGSGNLTQSGFMDNIELFEVLELETGGPGREVVESARRFVGGLAAFWANWPAHSLLAIDTLKEIDHKLADFSQKFVADPPDAPRLLTSFDGPFIDHFSTLANDGELLVAAPYFGGSVQGLKRLHAAVKPRRTQVFPATHGEDTVDLPVSEVRRLPGASLHSLAMTSKRDEFAHLKLYGFRNGDGDAWLFTGSVNCTEAALLGKNIEAGLLRRVPAGTLELYFAQDKKVAVPEDPRKEEQEKDSGWLTFYATDLGDAIEVVAAPGQDTRLPLKNVQLSLCYGGMRIPSDRPSLFDRGVAARLPWACFDEGRFSSHAARVLEIDATDCHGNRAHGAALVDDVAALSAEPTHRGAWRAALALLSAEEMPEYADIAALFQLVDDVVDIDENEDEDDPEMPANGSRAPEGSAEVIAKDKAPLWPPQPIHADPSLLTTASGRRGDLYWFNRILASLIHNPRRQGGEIGAHRREEGEDEGEVPEEVPPAVVSACERMLTQAQSSFERLENWLYYLEITPEKARKLWGPATFVFLGNLGIKKSIDRITGGDVYTPSVTSIINDYVGMMFADRDQGDDFSPPPRCCYENAVFPPIAADLGWRFEVYPHFEICAIILVSFAHLRAEADRSFALPQWLLFRDTAGDNLSLVYQDKEHLEHIWRRYFEDDERGVTWSTVEQAIGALPSIGWREHPGFQDLLRIQGFNGQGPIEAVAGSHDNLRGLDLCRKRGWPKGRVDRFTEACANPQCPRHARIDPRFRMLRDLRPVVCTACGYLHVPSELVEAFKKEHHG
jgi:hypothetical protein